MFFRVWLTGPEDVDWKKAYLYFWFIYLQDVMERAVLQEILSKMMTFTPRSVSKHVYNVDFVQENM